MSPQFCDDLTDNGKHLKANPRRKNKNQQPLQQVRELFPETVQKSAVRRNPLSFKQNRESDKCSMDDPCPVLSSQEISLYPSTFAPRSKQRVEKSESKDSDSVANEEEAKNDDQHDETGGCDVHGYHGDQSDYSGYQECPSLSLHESPQSHSVDDHTVPSASQQNSNNFDGVQLRLRLSATTQHSQCEDEQAESSRQNESRYTHQHTPGMRGSCSATCARTLPYVYHVDENESTHAEQVCNSEYSNPHAFIDDAGQQTSYSAVCSIENLSELVKDMSVVDDIANPECSTYTPTAIATEQSHSSQCEQDTKVHMQPRISSSCDHRLNQLEVTTFKPPIASTPFRDHSSPLKLFQGDVDSRLQGSPNTTMSCGFSNMQRTVTNVRFCDQEMSILVKETPEHLWCSPKLPHVKKGGLTRNGNPFKVSESIFDAGNIRHSNCSQYDNVVDENHSLAWQMCIDIGDVDMTTLKNFDDTDTTSNTMHGPPTATDESKCPCTCEHSAVPPTQDSTHYSEGEWSVLAKQTPNDLWCSPVVKVVDNSL